MCVEKKGVRHPARAQGAALPARTRGKLIQRSVPALEVLYKAAPGHAQDRRGLVAQARDLRARGEVPHQDEAILLAAHGDEQALIIAEAKGHDAMVVLLEAVHHLARGQVPHAHVAVIAALASGQQARRGRQRARAQGSAMPPQKHLRVRVHQVAHHGARASCSHQAHAARPAARGRSLRSRDRAHAIHLAVRRQHQEGAWHPAIEPYAVLQLSKARHGRCQRGNGDPPGRRRNPVCAAVLQRSMDHLRVVPLEESSTDLSALRDFVFHNHVEASSLCAASRAAQTSELPVDFPDLLSPEAFSTLGAGSWVVCDEAGTLVGASGLKRGDTPTTYALSYLFVAPRAQRRGMGRALLRAALAHAQALASAAGAPLTLQLLTLEGVYAPAVALYESEGFTLSRRVPASSDPGACPFYTLLYMEKSVGGSAPPAGAGAGPCHSLEPTVHVARGEGIRVLLLHGYSQTAPDLLARYKPLLDRKLKFCALVAPSAPFPLAGVAGRTWWFNRSPDPTRAGAYEGLDTSRALLLALIAQHGPFHGVLGFSQGAVLAHQLLAEGSLEVKWCILAAGFPSSMAPRSGGEGEAAPLLTVPSLHLTSQEDRTVAAERHAALAGRFADPVIVEHEHGHALVQKAEHCNLVAEFIRKHST